VELNTPSRRSQIIKILHDPAEMWRKTVQGYPITIRRQDDGSVSWSVVLFKKTRKVVGVEVEGVASTVFDALDAIESVVERRLMRTDT
jgi:hypothetical protein